MTSTPFSPTMPPSWYMTVQPNPAMSSSFWETGNVHNRLLDLRDTIGLAKEMRKELELLLLSNEACESSEKADNSINNASAHWLFEMVKEKLISLETQESHSCEAVNSLISTLRSQIEPFNVLLSQTSSWEEKSAAARLVDERCKYKRNKHWRKRKRQRNAEMLVKERERFDLADQEADEWRAREIAKDIARRKVEKMKEIAKHKANEERKKLESELELVLIVEKLQELRSIRIQKLKKQGHFLAEEDDKFVERVRAAVEEEERQAAAAADTDTAKEAIATAEESRKTIQSTGLLETQVQIVKSDTEAVEQKPDQRGFEGQTSGRAYDSMTSLPLEFYHYYHGSNTDMGTLIEVRRTWDAYIRPGGGSRIPGYWVQPPPPANEIWASYLLDHK